MEFAVVGAAVALPGVADVDLMRADLLAGTTHFDSITRSQALATGLAAAEIDEQSYVPTAAVLADADRFDREYFAMTAAEAAWTDPQQRLLLTLSHDAVESSGIATDTARFGVYATVSSSTYLWGRVPEAERTSPARVDYRSLLGNDRDFAASRIAYKLGCTGPAVTIQSACSSSLVALHQACLGLAYGDADVAVVAAASLKFPQEQGYIYEEGGILSPTGRSRPFDAGANGTIRGSGGGAVLLRRLDDALDHGDNILAVVAGTAVNNDGARRMSFSAPAVGGQQDVLAQAVRRAGISADQVGYIEAHGTGTPIGDPIEFRALSRVYAGSAGDRPRYLGAAKANYGHLDVAAGLVGLLKTILVLQERTVFPHPSFTEPNPAVPLEKSGFDIATEPVAVPDLEYAAVSSFGMGGTNGHVVLRRAPHRVVSVKSDVALEITISNRHAEGLSDYRRRLARYLRTRPEIGVHDLATTLDRRTRHEHTWTATVASTAEFADALERDDALEQPSGPVARPEGQTIWLPPSPLGGEVCALPLLVGDRAEAPARREVREIDVHALFLDLVAAELGIEAEPDTDFFAAGGESMALVALVGKLTDIAGFHADFDALDGVVRVGEMAAVLAGQANRSPSAERDLMLFGQGRPEIYLYPPSGGTTFCYAALQRDLPGTTLAAFRAVRSATTVEQIAESCVRTLRHHQALGPDLVIGGYSFGGNVAFEIARRLEQLEHIPPRRIVLFDSFAPHAFGAAGAASGDLADEVERMLSAAEADLPGYRSDTDLDAAGESVRSAFGEIWAANNRALVNYRPEHRISVPITLIRANTRLSAERSRALGIEVDRAAEWERWTSGRVEILDVPGDHYTMFTDPAHRSVAAAELASVLRVVRTGSRTTA
ncbi:MAG: hypothetical protein J2P18_08295 [Nocardia sp.]|nr:hypothetical protein [Nocardia sp.]